MGANGIDPQSTWLGEYEGAVASRVVDLQKIDFSNRFWAKDATLWGGDEERQKAVASMLGWIDVLPKIKARLDEIESFVADVRAAGYERVILAGMGGSSLAPLVFTECYPKGEGGLKVDVLDSTDPETVSRIANAGPLDKTLVIVASKSGSTAEPNAFSSYLYEKIGKPENFVAITDPGSPFIGVAEKKKFRKIFLNYPDIGGRFSALSLFGLVPAALHGLSVAQILQRAQDMVDASTSASSPAFYLGAALGELTQQGRDKLTFFTVDRQGSLGLWMEQLLAESTGKEGTGILPIAGETPGAPNVYENDRIFVVFRPEGEDTTALDSTAAALKAAGHPVIVIDLEGPYAIAQEFMRFEIATATIGAILDINPFDQPNVQEAKDITKKLLGEIAKDGKLPQEEPSLTDGDFKVYSANEGTTVESALQAFLKERQPGDYVALMAYLPESDELTTELHNLQKTVRDVTKLATTMGYGPRFLHSTGQFHKGGPATGFFIQLTGSHAHDAPVPNFGATWGQFIDAQAMGDLKALESKGRRGIRIDLGSNLVVALRDLQQIVARALA